MKRRKLPPIDKLLLCLPQKEKEVMSTSDCAEKSMSCSRGRLLIVDDERSNRDIISNILTSEGYEVLTARDGLDALDRLVEPLPHAIISDLNMPRMSGYEFLAVVRRKFPHLPVIAMSGEFDGNELPTGVLADAYLPKGQYTFDQLRTTIIALVAAPPRRPRTVAADI